MKKYFHRISCFIIAIVLVFSYVPQLTISANEYIYEDLGHNHEHGSYWQELYRDIYEAVSQKQPSLVFEYPEWHYEIPTQSDILNIYYHSVLNDHPELFWCEPSWQTSFAGDGSRAEITFSYYLTEEIYAQQFEASARELYNAAGIRDDMSEFEKALRLHDTICDLFEYDLDAPYNQSAYSGIVNHRTVCRGYAKSYQYLLHMAGIDATTVTGTAGGENHEWLFLKIDGDYYYSDVTWDDNFFDQNGIQNYGYFNVTLEEIDIDHDFAEYLYWTYPEATSHDASYFNGIGGNMSATLPSYNWILDRLSTNCGKAIIKLTSGTAEEFAGWLGTPSINDGHNGLISPYSAILAETGHGGIDLRYLGTTVWIELTGEHVFDRQVPNDDFLASEADENNPARYYYSCGCGARGTETFEYGVAAAPLAVWSGNVAQGFDSGNGSKNDPYVIRTAEQLAYLSASVNAGNTYSGAYFVLACDIKLNDTDQWEEWEDRAPANEWIPIGNATYAFEGNFYGGGHVVYGMYVDRQDESYTGLFGCVKSSTVSGLGNEQFFVRGGLSTGGLLSNTGSYSVVEFCHASGVVKGGHYTGGLIGTVSNGTVKNCYAEATVDASYAVGGICGDIYEATIKGCFFSGNVKGSLEAVGGICGYPNKGLVEDCYSAGSVSGTHYIGGVCGYVHSSTISTSYSLSSVQGTSYNVGGVCGVCWESTVFRCCYLTGKAVDGSGTVQNGTGKNELGKTAGDGYTSTRGLSEENACLAISYPAFDFANIWTIGAVDGFDYPTLRWQTEGLKTSEKIWSGNVAPGFESGSGTENDPYIVKTGDQLAFLAFSVNSGNSYAGKYIRLAGNIYLNDTKNWTEYDDSGLKNLWTPIGNADSKFSGNFDGSGYVVYGINVSGNEDPYKGLFGFIDGARISRLGIDKSSVKGGMFVGALCGYANSCTITDCYSLGTVRGSQNVGGLCGYVSSGMLSSCYSACNTEGSVMTGAIAGNVSGSSISDCYYRTGRAYDSDYTSQNGIGCATVSEKNPDEPGSTTGLDEEKMSFIFLFDGFDFDNVWKKGSVNGYGYPELRKISADQGNPTTLWNGTPADMFESGSGTKENPYIIRTAEQLALLAELINNGRQYYGLYFELAEDIYLNDITFFEDWENSAPANEWTPIGNSGSHFRGYINGNDHCIYGLYINDSSKDYVGLFGYIEYGTVENIRLEKTFVRGNTYVGSVAGSNNGGRIENCSNTGVVSGSEIVGGISGYNKGSVYYCLNYSTVTGSYSTGGIVGRSEGGLIEGCGNLGDLLSGTSSMGGVCGYLQNSGISNSFNKGNIYSGQYSGGISGYLRSASSYSAEIENCYNTGNIKCTGSYIAGICGYVYGDYISKYDMYLGTVINCYSTGTVSGSSYTGLIAGRNYYGKIDGCYALADGNGTSAVADTTRGVTNAAILSEEDLRDAASFAGYDFENTWKIGAINGYSYPILFWQRNAAEETVVPGHTHAFNRRIIAAQFQKVASTCHSRAVYYYSCDCGEHGTETFEYGGYAPHHLVKVTDEIYLKKAATCTSAAVYYKSCSVCGAAGDETFTYGGFAPHSFNAALVSPEYLVLNATENRAARYCYSCEYCGLAGSDTFEYGYPLGPVTIWNGTVTYGFDSGIGTAIDPYIIRTAGQLAYLAYIVNSGYGFSGKHFALTEDIYLNDLTSWKGWKNNAPDNEWTAIGTASNPFRGNFNGNSHVVYGMYLNKPSETDQGLFGSISGGTVSCLGVESFYVNGDSYVGGLAGSIHDSCSVESCYASGMINGYAGAGVLCGFASSSTVTACYSAGSLSTSECYAGGICGYAVYSTLSSCYSACGIKGDESFVGGICGNADNCLAESCYYLAGSAIDGSNTEQNGFGCYSIGGTLPDQANAVKGLTIDQMSLSSSFEWFDFDQMWTIGKIAGYNYPTLAWQLTTVDPEEVVWDGSAAGGFDSGRGTEEDPYVIKTAEQLAYLAQATLNGNSFGGCHIKLDNDIYLNSTADWKNWSVSPPVNTWQPIGLGSAFGGVFDGNGHTVFGIYINTDASDQGLFGHITGTVQNVGVNKSFIRGASNVAAICGENEGVVQYCYNFGTVVGTSRSGGICGYVYYGKVINCYNGGNISGNQAAGGIAGVLTYTNIASDDWAGRALYHCYNIGLIDAERYVGGILGYAHYGCPSDCYYLEGCATDKTGTVQNGIGTSDPGNVARDDGTYRCTKEQLTEYTTFGGFDFNNVWTIGAVDGYKYPTLKWQKTLGFPESIIWDGMTASGFDSGSGTEDDPYIIRTHKQLAYLASQVNGGTSYSGTYFKLVNDIYLNDVTDWANWPNDPPENEWTPIGNGDFCFSGNFDGNGHSIFGVYINDESLDYQGLFGRTINGKISSLEVELAHIRGKSYVGGVCGAASSETLADCFSTGIISGYGSLGGICGIADQSTIRSCHSEGTISGSSWSIGGICGELSFSSTIDKCYSTGAVLGSSTSLFVGGICGRTFNSCTISNCFSTCDIEGQGYLGGIAGNVISVTMTNCFATGNVTGSFGIGGISGYVQSNSTVSKCYTAGIIRGDNCGGAFGSVNYSTIEDCYYMAQNAIGNNGSVRYGIDGISDTKGQVVALNESQMRDSSSFEGFDFDEIWAIGSIDDYSYPTLKWQRNMGGNSFIQGDHVHDFSRQSIIGKYLKTPATCTSGAVYYYSCKCGEIGTETFEYGNPVAHSYIQIVDDAYMKNEATCYSGAVYYVSCSVCGSKGSDTFEFGEVGSHKFTAKNHNTKYLYSPATEQSAAKYYYSCKYCGLAGTEMFEYGKPLGAVVIWDGTVASGFESGTGTESDPFIIKTPEQLAYFSQLSRQGRSFQGQYVALANDIYLNDPAGFELWGTMPHANTWLSAGNFYGTFDGRGFAVFGIFGQNGLIAGLYSGTIKNVGVRQSYITSGSGICGYAQYGMIENCYNTGWIYGDSYVGGICGRTESSTITGCWNSGKVEGGYYSGGICGAIFGDSKIINCFNAGDINRSGIVEGNFSNYGDDGLVNCYNIGKTISNGHPISGTSNGCKNCYYLDESVGEAYTYGDSVSLSAVQMADANSFAGFDFDNVWDIGVVGGYDYPTLRWQSEVFLAADEHVHIFSGGIIDDAYLKTPATNDRPAEYYRACEACGEICDDTFEYGLPLSQQDGRPFVWSGARTLGFESGSGKSKDPYIIKTAEQLAYFMFSVNNGNLYSGRYIKLENDVLLNDTSDWLNWENTAPQNVWAPIGNENNKFRGYFDGAGHKISGVYVNNYLDNQGLFGLITGGSIENLVLDCSYVKGNQYIGGICGKCENRAAIRGCGFSGTVIGNQIVGGICGYNESGGIEGCYNHGNISATAYGVGGICGSLLNFTQNLTQIKSCYNNGMIVGTNAGGIVGECVTPVVSCYNAGNVTGSNSGAICGSGDSCEFISCYYLEGSAMSGVGNKEDKAGETEALNSLEIRDFDSFRSFDFINTWTIGIVAGYDYPTLRWEKTAEEVGHTHDFNKKSNRIEYLKTEAPCQENNEYYYACSCGEKGDNTFFAKNEHSFVRRCTDERYLKSPANASGLAEYYYSCSKCGEVGSETFLTSMPSGVTVWDGSRASSFDSGSGTEDDPYIIRTPEQLAYFAYRVNSGALSGYYKLAKDIYLNDLTYADEWVTNPPENKWEAIVGTIRKAGYDRFSGTFDGDGHAIYGMFIDSDKDYQGFFGYSKGTILNLSIENSLIRGSEYVGALCGYNGGRIANCSNNGTVIGKWYVGGICGESWGNGIDNCVNTGTVSSSGPYCGGICGYNVIGSITVCFNTGTVSGHSFVGGICGELRADTNIFDSYNTGIVSASSGYAGGIVATLSYGTVARCYNTGTVKSESCAGGIAGGVWHYLNDCYNAGTVTGNIYVGGICGVLWNDGTKDSGIARCYSAGTVKGTSDYVGGVIGQYNGGTVENCMYLSGSATDGLGTAQKGIGCETQGQYLGDVDGQTAGLTVSQMKQKANYQAFDFENVWAIGVIDGYDYPTLRWQNDMGVQPVHVHDLTVQVIDDAHLASPATCVSRARYYYECSECGEMGNVTFEYGDYAPHTLAHYNAKAATCSEPGHKAYDVCSVCGYSTYVHIPATGHKYVLAVEKEATCTEDGLIRYTCSVCHDSYTVVTAHGEHDFTAEYVAPTCTEDGEWIYICSKCGYERHETIPAAHNYVMAVVKKATRDEDGILRYTCSVCGDWYDEAIPKREHGTVLLVQDSAPWEQDNASALIRKLFDEQYVDGYDVVPSSKLGETVLSEYDVIYIANDQATYTYNAIANLHNDLEAFVRSGGVLIYGACDHGWQGGNISAALPGGVTKSNYYSMRNYIVDSIHPIVSGALTDGQALTNGLLLGTYCSHTYFNKNTLPDDANVILTDANGNPTLLEYSLGNGNVILSGLTWEFYYTRIYQGNTTYSKCVFDDLIVYGISISNYNTCVHEYGEGTVVQPTCDTDGYTVHTCSKCGKTYKDEIVPATGHSLGEWIVDSTADCTHEGVKHQVCSECGEIVTYVTPATGHTWSEGYDHNGSYHWHVCTVCRAEGRHYSHSGGTRTCTEKAVCEVCGTSYGNYAAHSYTVKNTAPEYLKSAATCTQKAKYYYSCSQCGAKGTSTFEYGDYAPHTLTHYNAKAATCSEPGHKAYDVCSVCGYSTYVHIPATGHKYVLAVEKEATCTEDGLIRYTCSVCHDSYTVVTAHGEHDFTAEYVAPTCTEDGEWIYICSKCGYERHETIPAAHSYVMAVVKKATRDEDGILRYTCSVCGDWYDEAIPKREHGTVLLVQDSAPWEQDNASALIRKLFDEQYVDGYDVVPSSKLGETVLSEYDVIYIANDQATYTYNAIANLHNDLEAFVRSGGVLIYGTCDHGWQGGNISAALPGGVTKSNYYSMRNYIVDSIHPIVSGALTDGQALTNGLLLGTYCSHTYFNKNTLPDDANVILTDANGNPTLLEYSLGNGNVILSGLTWEFYYTRIYQGNTTYSKCVFDDLIVYGISISNYNQCIHEYGEGAVVQPTCDTDGYTVHTCSKCGKTYKDEIVPATGHSLDEWIVDSTADCSHEGVKHQVCSECGEIVTYVTPATGHTWSEGYDHNGSYHWHVCTVCRAEGRHYSHSGGTRTCTEKAVCEVCGTSYGSYAAHSYTVKNTSPEYLKSAATCSQKAKYYYSCSQCGAKGTNTFEYGGYADHDLEHRDGKAATCSESGYAAYDVCRNCGYSTYKYIPALGHKYAVTVEKEATCTEDGLIRYTCSVCHDTYTTVTAHGEHDFETDYKAPTCTVDGEKIYICKKCGLERHEKIPASHKYSLSVVKKATRDEDGILRYTCSVCGHYYEEIIPAREHGTVLLVQDNAPWDEDNASSLLLRLLNGDYIDGYDVVSSAALATTVLGEYDVIYIANDQSTYTYNAIANMHEALTQFVREGGVLIYGACDEGWHGGSIGYALPGGVTKANNYSMRNYIVDSAHPLVSGAFTDGQMLTNDLLLGTYCSHTYFNKSTLPENANVILTDGNGNPTLVEYAVGEGSVILSGLTWEFYYTRIYQGDTTYSKCVFDDLIVYGISISNYNTCVHEYGEGVTVPATCTEDGYTVHTCSKCGKTYKDGIVPATGHDLGEWIVAVEADCSHEGRKYQICRECGETVNYVTPMTEHTWSEGYSHNGSYHWHVCTVCGTEGYSYAHDFTAQNTDAAYLKSAATHQSPARYYYSCAECGAAGTSWFEHGEPLTIGEVTLSAEPGKAAPAMTFSVPVKATAVQGKGAEFKLTINTSVVSIVNVTAASGVTVSRSGNVITVKTERQISVGETLVTLSLKTGNRLAAGKYNVITSDGQGDSFAKLTTYDWGDVNMDGKVNSRDAVLIQQYAVKMVTFDSLQLALADVYNDGKINSRDAVLIQQYAVKMDVTLGVK